MESGPIVRVLFMVYMSTASGHLCLLNPLQRGPLYELDKKGNLVSNVWGVVNFAQFI